MLLNIQRPKLVGRKLNFWKITGKQFYHRLSTILSSLFHFAIWHGCYVFVCFSWLCRCLCTCVHVCVEVFLTCFHFFKPWDGELLTVLGISPVLWKFTFIWPSLLGCRHTVCQTSLVASIELDCRHTVCHASWMASVDLNSVLYDCTMNTLLTEPSPPIFYTLC